MTKKVKTRICCICGTKYHGPGNNPNPVKTQGCCCDKCNEMVVLPARFNETLISKKLLGIDNTPSYP